MNQTTHNEDELVSLLLWTIRRLPKIHREFAYEELIETVGKEHKYLNDKSVLEEINSILNNKEDE